MNGQTDGRYGKPGVAGVFFFSGGLTGRWSGGRRVVARNERDGITNGTNTCTKHELILAIMVSGF